jgi:PIN domain nuclease of toxin-antitoxin system
MRANDLLLDTCAAIWMAQGAFMEPAALEAMAQANEDGRPLRLSLITAWELGLLAKSGRVAMAAAPGAIFQSFLRLPGVQSQQLTAEILIDSSLLPGKVHGDPADRIIISTARTLDLMVVTRDRHILDYASQGYVRALPC